MVHARVAQSLRLPEELAAFLQGGRIVIFATRDASLRPHLARALAPRLEPGHRRMALCVPIRESGQCLQDLQFHPRIAITFSEPTTYRTYQLKGRVVGRRDLGAPEHEALARYTEGLTEACLAVGMPEGLVQRLWSDRFTRLDVALEQAFAQTPGAGAGDPL